MKEFPDFSEMNDKEILINFVDWTRDSLNDLATKPFDSKGDLLFYENLLEPMREALEEVEPNWNELRTEVENFEEEQMSRHGLYGAQLRFKILSIGNRVNVFLRRRPRFLLRRALDAVNTLLNSILDAAGVGSAVSEVKDTIRDAISDERD